MEKIQVLNYINTTSQKVFDALTTEKGLAETWTSQLRVKPEKGFINEFYFVDERPVQMKIIEIDPNIKLTWECLGYEPEWVGTTVSFDVFERDAVTTVVLQHSGWKSTNDFFRWCTYNWSMFLFSLKLYCEDGQGLPFQRRKF